MRASSAVHDKERILYKDRAGYAVPQDNRPSTTHALYRVSLTAQVPPAPTCCTGYVKVAQEALQIQIPSTSGFFSRYLEWCQVFGSDVDS